VPLTGTELAAVIRKHLPTDQQLAEVHADIADVVALGKQPKQAAIRRISATLYAMASGRRPDASTFIELSVDGLFNALKIPLQDLEKVFLRPADVVLGFVAQNVGLGQQLHRVYADVAHIMSYRGQPTLAVEYFRRSISATQDAQLHDRLFHAMMMSPETTNEMMLEEARRWARLYAPAVQVRRDFDRDRDSNKRLRIGYVCCFFYGLGTRIMHLPLMRGHDRNRFEVVAYSDADVEDTFKAADTWRITEKLEDDAFAQLVLEDRIDILVEFNGRGGRNRFDAFAKRLAPVQLNFGNFLATSGMPQVDYTVAHVVSVPPEEDRFYTERVCRLGRVAISYDQCWPKDFFPPVAPPPYRTAGRITFGCFGGSIKVHERLVEAWCEVVRRVEHSRFYFKAISMSDPGALESFQRMFERHGLTGDRLILEGGSDHRAMLELYGRVDVALDTFPYNSGNTTLETLWQGIPVVTLRGERWASRTGASFLTLGGLDQFIAESWEEYVEMAVRLAADNDFRDNFRASVRHQLRQSALFDMPGFIREFESAYRDMWRSWLETSHS
jgi:predicted O-linked N-acetylglucosamine transferase (SPINDLY family)